MAEPSTETKPKTEPAQHGHGPYVDQQQRQAEQRELKERQEKKQQERDTGEHEVTIFRGQLHSDFIPIQRTEIQVAPSDVKDAEGKTVSKDMLPEFQVVDTGAGQSQIQLQTRHEGDLTFKCTTKKAK